MKPKIKMGWLTRDGKRSVIGSLYCVWDGPKPTWRKDSEIWGKSKVGNRYYTAYSSRKWHKVYPRTDLHLKPGGIMRIKFVGEDGPYIVPAGEAK